MSISCVRRAEAAYAAQDAALIAAARGNRALAQHHLYRALSINPS
jgi:hypothetical protein